jgi:mono/diheme cytochrome c family protein
MSTTLSSQIKEFIMKVNTAISSGMILIFFFLSPSTFAQTLPDDPTIGGGLFKNKGCVKCHSIKGKGGQVGPDLGDADLGNTQLDLAAKIWNHTPSMVAEMEKTGIKPNLTGVDFGEITSYLYFLRFFDEPGDPDAGKYLFDQKGCLSCHQLFGKGKEGELGLDKFPRNISPVFFSQAIWNHGIEMMARMVQYGKRWPIFADREMMDLLEFIRTHAKDAEEPAFFKAGSPREGKLVFDARECTKCHSIRGKGAEGGIDLAERSKTFYTSLTQIASSIWNKAPEMMLIRIAQTQCGLPKFTSKEMSDLLAYLYFLRYIDEPGDTAKGKKLFSEMQCSQCHGLEGKPGKLMYIDLSKHRNAAPTAIVAEIWNHNVEMRKAMTVQGIPWPQLKKGEMADLLEFIRNPQ